MCTVGMNDRGGTYSWFLRPHEVQSHGTVYIEDGKAVVYCAAYHENPDVEIVYSLVRVDNPDEGAYSACPASTDVKCGKSSVNGDITSKYTIKTNHLQMRTNSCEYTFLNPNKHTYACIAKRVMNNRLSSSQVSVAELSDPMELGTFHFSERQLLTSREAMEIFIPVGVLVGILIGVVGILMVIGILYKKQKKSERVHVSLVVYVS